MIHIAAISQIRLDTDGRSYYRRKQAAGKTKLEALRCLKRRLSDVVYRHLVHDQTAASPGGQVGASTKSSAAGQTPRTSTSDKSLPGLHKQATTAVA